MTFDFNPPPQFGDFLFPPISSTLSPSMQFFNWQVTLWFPLFPSPHLPCPTPKQVCGLFLKIRYQVLATALARSLLLISMPSCIYALQNYHGGLLKYKVVGISALLPPLQRNNIAGTTRPSPSGPAYFSATILSDRFILLHQPAGFLSLPQHAQPSYFLL